jgi:signal recognition particle subunit SRP19
MRNQNKVFLWSVYFDSSKSRNKGRRVHKKLAVSDPKLEELSTAAKRLGIQAKIVLDAKHPNLPWRSCGLLVVPKTEKKGKLLKDIARELTSLRR